MGTEWSVQPEEVRQAAELLRRLVADPVTGAGFPLELGTLDAAAEALGQMATVMEREARVLAAVNDPGFRGGLAGFLELATKVDA
jgi:hypothetical protein